MSGELIFDSAVLCELIRREDNGKLLLIGVYTGAILVPAFPAVLQMSLMAQYRVADGSGGTKEFEIQVTGPHGVDYGKLAGNIQVVDGTIPDAFVIPPIPMNVQLPGDIKFEYRSGGGEWKTLKIIPVIETKEFNAKIEALKAKLGFSN